MRSDSCETRPVRAGDWRRIALITALTAATAVSGGFVTSLTAAGAAPQALPADSASPTAYPSLTDSPTATPSATATPSPTLTPTATPSATPPGAPSSATIVIGHDAQHFGYQTPNITLAGGGMLTVVNQDAREHTVTSRETDANGRPLFDIYAEPGTTTNIPSASKLAPGTYHFYCRFHPTTMKGTLTIQGDGGGNVHPTAPKFEQPLFIPPTLTGSKLRIPIKQAKVRVLPHGPLTSMWTYGGTYPGPTIERPVGQDTKVTFVDKLPASDGAFSVHYHGDHHASKDDGQPTTYLIKAGHSRTYDFPLTDGGQAERAAFNYYHDHRMGLTGRNVWNGLTGMFITTDAKSKQLRLPDGKYDVPLMVSNRSFTKDNQLTHPLPNHAVMNPVGNQAPPGDATVGAQTLANGRFAPYLNVSTHRYRLRLLNGSNWSAYNFQLSDGRPFIQVGTGNGLLPKPVVRNQILLGPAQRVDVIVDFHSELGKKVVLESVPRSDAPAGGIETPSVAIMQFRVTAKAHGDKSRIPTTLQAPPPIKAPRQVTAVWDFNVVGDPSTGSHWVVNGKPFDPNRVDLKVPLGSTQTWLLRNSSPITHFIHLHEELWHTIARDGKTPPPWERGLEDTWKLDPGETVKVAARFTDYTGKFMLHCHMLDHEDHGLMTQFEVVRTKGTAATGPAARAARLDRQWARQAAAHTSRIWGLRIVTAAFGMPRAAAFGLSPAELKKLMCGPKYG